MAENPLRVSEAARRLGVTTKELLQLMHVGKVDYVMRDGIAHVLPTALDRYRTTSS